MKRILKVATLGLCAAGCAGAVIESPRLLRRADAFRVQHVAVIGTRYLPAHDALYASGITPVSNLFDDREEWLRSLLRHPMVAGAEVERRLPGTLLLRIRETEPVALVATPELRAVDASGRVLPVEPWTAALDLPVVALNEALSDDHAPSPELLGVLGALERIRGADPALAEMISEAQARGRDELRIRLRAPAGVEALLPLVPTSDGLRDLRATLDDLVARGELARARRVDARFRDQVVVSFNPRAVG